MTKYYGDGFLVVLLLGCLLLWQACTSAGVQTYVLSKPQIQAMAAAANIAPCPDGKFNIAGLVENDTGGVLTLKCGVGVPR